VSDTAFHTSAHVEQVHEEVVRERLGPLREGAVLLTVHVRAEHTEAADEVRHSGAVNVSSCARSIRSASDGVLNRSFE
jgi:hypothetical protein